MTLRSRSLKIKNLQNIDVKRYDLWPIIDDVYSLQDEVDNLNIRTQAYRIISADDFFTEDDYTIECTGTGLYTVTALDPATVEGEPFQLINASVGVVIMATPSGVIGNDTRAQSTFRLYPGEVLDFKSNGVDYRLT